MKRAVWGIMLSVLLLSGCVTRTGGVTVISDRNVNTKDVNINDLPQKKQIVGESKKWKILWYTIGTPTLKEALEDALNKGDGDLLIDASMYDTYWSVGLFGQVGQELRGTVVSTRGAK